MKRRSFLRTAGAGAVTLSTGLAGSPQQATAQGALGDAEPVLVKIFLRGGQDQLNTFVPYTDKTYYGIRPTIAIPEQDVVKLDNRWGLHPAMQPLKRFYDEGRFAAVINSGSPHPTRSHFDAQDFMEYAAPGDRTVHDGWLNRYLAATANPRGENPEHIRALAMQERLPRSMRGDYTAVAVPPNLQEIDEVLDLFEDFYQAGDPQAPRPAVAGIEADPVVLTGQQTIRSLRRLRELLYGEEKPGYGSNRTEDIEAAAFQEYPGGWFASRLQALARVIKAGVGLQVAATDINGWDHHIGLGSTDGSLNRMLAFVATSLAAFMDDLGPDLDRTLILVSTEFGRVCAENGNDGSDHGHGGATWLLGGKVKGGRIYGRWSGLEPSELNEKRDLKVTTDFREIYADILRDHMGFDLPAGFFPDYTPSKRGLGLFS